MAVRHVIQAGDSALKKKNELVMSLTTDTMQQLLIDLRDTMYEQDLIGIAAPQIAENYMVFVTHARNTSARNIGKEDTLRVFINPRIVSVSRQTGEIYEGCGSLEGVFGPVIRPKEITVQAHDEKGREFSLTCDGILARVIQHEMDHLHGVEFIQKVSDYGKIIMKEHYSEKVKNTKAQQNASKIRKVEYEIVS